MLYERYSMWLYTNVQARRIHADSPHLYITLYHDDILHDDYNTHDFHVEYNHNLWGYWRNTISKICDVLTTASSKIYRKVCAGCAGRTWELYTHVVQQNETSIKYICVISHRRCDYEYIGGSNINMHVHTWPSAVSLGVVSWWRWAAWSVAFRRWRWTLTRSSLTVALNHTFTSRATAEYSSIQI